MYNHKKNSGISLQLLNQIIVKLGLTISPEDLCYVFQFIDKDNSGEIDMQEFLHFMKSSARVKDYRI
jgi:Ca2+-binding EF-hand superfamily protein